MLQVVKGLKHQKTQTTIKKSKLELYVIKILKKLSLWPKETMAVIVKLYGRSTVFVTLNKNDGHCMR